MSCIKPLNANTMKNIILTPVLYFIIAVSCLHSQTNSIKVSSTGKVGINLASPTYQLDVAGNARIAYLGKSIAFDGTSLCPLVSGVDLGSVSINWTRLYATNLFSTNETFVNAPYIMSDLNLKINIADLSTMKDKLLSLRPVSYNLNPDFPGLAIDKTQNNAQIGFIAQELQAVFPDMVAKQENGLLAIRYTELIPILVKVLKEQQVEINALKQRVTDLEKSSK
jgi:hypothetical protein